MIRRAAAFVLALTLSPVLVSAQDTALTINVQSAEVYKGPSNVTPVIGHVSRGTVLPISRNLGSWVKIAWPDAADGVGYVRVTMGRIGQYNGAPAAANGSPRTSSASPTATKAPPPARTAVPQHAAPRVPLNVTPASHLVGIGGMVGTMSTFGATTRAWRNNRIGIQFAVTRDAMTSADATGRVTSMQFEPGVLYAPFDHVSDYVWIRPYVGTGVSLRHQTLSVPDAPESTSDNGVGFRIFGGSELTFASVPQFGLSVDLGYRRFAAPFPGFEADPVSLSIAGHWYFK